MKTPEKAIEINAGLLPPKSYIVIGWDNELKSISIRVDQLDEFLAAYVISQTIQEPTDEN